MPFVVIKGTYHVVGYSPDGDSVRFKAHNEANWKKLGGPPVGLNAQRHAQLRLEAIDTLETHYHDLHQPLALATKALTFLLNELGITRVQWNPSHTRVTAAHDGTEGYIIAREVEPNHRPVSFAFRGNPPEADGSSVFLDEARMRQSLNWKSLEAGLAYPTYYKGLFFDLRKALSQAVAGARKAGYEIWSENRTNTGVTINKLDDITEGNVVLPKLFRRLVEYLEGGGPVSGFKEFLAARQEGVFVISTAHATHFDTVVDVTENVVRLTEPPENLIFEG